MKWKKGKGNNRDVIDIRGAKRGGRTRGGSGGLGGLGGLGGGGGLKLPGGKGGLGGGIGLIVIVIVIGSQLLGGGGGNSGFDITSVLNGTGQVPGADSPAPLPPGEDPQKDLRDFSAYVFNDSQQTWKRTFAQDGARYNPAKLVFYADAVSTGGCGNASSAVGPFYCPADQRVYLDLSFYKDMERQLGATGDFAWAYVIAHEMGHHVQKQTGVSDEVAAQRRSDPGGAEGISVRTELQADCYAGVWASTVFDQLEPGDLDEAFNAAEAVGDDHIQGRGGGSVNPDSFTHGTSAQRRDWFNKGYESADPGVCDTFSGDI